MNYTENVYKNDLVKNLPQFVKNNMEDREVYFVTVTFENTSYEYSDDVYSRYLKNLYLNINKATLNNNRKDQRALMFAIKEKSYKLCRKKSPKHPQMKPDHYHCILLIPTKCMDRFFRRAVKYQVIEHDPKLKKDVSILVLKDKVIKTADRVKCYDIDVRKPDSFDDVSMVCGYNCKEFGAKNLNYTHADVAEYKRGLNLKEIESIKSEESFDRKFLLFS